MTLTSARLAIHGGEPVRTTPIGQWPEFGREEEDLLLAALRSGKWGSLDGTYVNQFEREFAAFQAAKFGVTTVNATMGLAVAYKAVGLEPGDEVIVPAYTFIATASAALMIGAIPVFADVDPETLLISPDSIEAAVTPRTRAIVPVHHGGSPVEGSRCGGGAVVFSFSPSAVAFATFACCTSGFSNWLTADWIEAVGAESSP